MLDAPLPRAAASTLEPLHHTDVAEHIRDDAAAWAEQTQPSPAAGDRPQADRVVHTGIRLPHPRCAPDLSTTASSLMLDRGRTAVPQLVPGRDRHRPTTTPRRTLGLTVATELFDAARHCGRHLRQPTRRHGHDVAYAATAANSQSHQLRPTTCTTSSTTRTMSTMADDKPLAGKVAYVDWSRTRTRTFTLHPVGARAGADDIVAIDAPAGWSPSYNGYPPATARGPRRDGGPGGGRGSQDLAEEVDVRDARRTAAGGRRRHWSSSGCLDIVVANAGVLNWGRLWEISRRKQWQDISTPT